MQGAVEQAEEEAADPSKPETLLLCHHRIPRSVVIGGTIRDTATHDNGFMTFDKTWARSASRHSILNTFWSLAKASRANSLLGSQ